MSEANEQVGPDLYDYLREQCPDLESAKAWIHRWAEDWGQVLPWDDKPEFTMRAMAGHLSNVLEGGTSDTGYATGTISYMSTKHGSDLYWAACGVST